MQHNFFQPDREIDHVDSYNFGDNWDYIERNAVASTFKKYNLSNYLLDEDDADIPSDLELTDDEFADLLKFSFQKSDKFRLLFGRRTLVVSEKLDDFLLLVKAYFKNCQKQYEKFGQELSAIAVN